MHYCFALFRYVGDPINNMVGQDTTLEERAELKERLGLNDPFIIQFYRFVEMLLWVNLASRINTDVLSRNS